MSNRETLFRHVDQQAEFFIYESAENDYALGVDIDGEHVDLHVKIGTGLTSKQVIEIALEMIDAAAPWEGPACGVIARASVAIREAIK